MSLNELVQQLGIAQEETVAIGDGANDIGMLQWAGLGICMGQALDAVKMVTDMVTGTNDQDGVAKAVEELQRQGRL
jgi:hydroxymethylpyrimidine pyrophosphatase-like HAD family hydrolase